MGVSNSPLDDTTPERRRLWQKNMLLANLVELASESSRGIVLPTLYLYVLSLGGDIKFMGLVISIFSFARFISSTFLGWLADNWSYKNAYLLSISFSVFGNMLYVIAGVVGGTTGRFILLVGRFLVGFGAGNRSICRSTVAALTTPGLRLKYMSVITMTIYFGYAITPGLSRVLPKEDLHVLGLHLNQYMVPGMALVVLNGVVLLLARMWFDETLSSADCPDADLAETKPLLPTSNSSSSSSDRKPDSIDKNDTSPVAAADATVGWSVLVCLLVFTGMNAVSRGVLSVFETESSSLFLRAAHLAPGSKEAVAESAMFFLYLGLLGLVTFLWLEHARRRWQDDVIMFLGFLFTSAGCVVLTLANAFPPPSPAEQVEEEMDMGALVAAEVLVWCIGSPVTAAVVAASFSKALGSRKQGRAMGMFGSAASGARMVLPLFVTQLPIERALACCSLMCVLCCCAAFAYMRSTRVVV